MGHHGDVVRRHDLGAVFPVDFVAVVVLRVVADTVQDELVVNFQLQASNFRQDTIGFQEINVMLGARRYYIDEKLHQVWIPEQSYHKGSWGYIGGKVYKGNNNRIPYGSDRNVLITENDPVYQTQRQGISAFKFDVADGEYELRLHFAELVGGEKKEALAYNLDDHSKKEQQEQRLFDVQINGLPFLSKINLAEDYGYLTAVEKTTRISVTGGNGIEIGFIAIKGEPVLNG
ncbi:MAG: beta-galactosidase, partial [Deltaproteobacteria bacterium]